LKKKEQLRKIAANFNRQFHHQALEEIATLEFPPMCGFSLSSASQGREE